MFSPASGTNAPVAVTITDATSNALIYYTLDGSLPTQNSTLYSNAISLSTPGVVRAVAFASGYAPSIASDAFYGPAGAAVNAQVTRSINTNSPTAPIVSFSITPSSRSQLHRGDGIAPAGVGGGKRVGRRQLPCRRQHHFVGAFFGSRAA